MGSSWLGAPVPRSAHLSRRRLCLRRRPPDVFRMPRVVWGHERSLARAFNERPTEAGLLVVVQAAKAIRVDIAPAVGGCPVAAGVLLQTGGPIAAQHRA